MLRRLHRHPLLYRPTQVTIFVYGRTHVFFKTYKFYRAILSDFMGNRRYSLCVFRSATAAEKWGERVVRKWTGIQVCAPLPWWIRAWYILTDWVYHATLRWTVVEVRPVEPAQVGPSRTT